MEISYARSNADLTGLEVIGINRSGFEEVEHLEALVGRIQKFVDNVKLGQRQSIVCLFPEDIKTENHVAVQLVFDARVVTNGTETQPKEKYVVVKGIFGDGKVHNLLNKPVGNEQVTDIEGRAKVSANSQFLYNNLMLVGMGGKSMIGYRLTVPVSVNSSDKNLTEFELRIRSLADARIRQLRVTLSTHFAQSFLNTQNAPMMRMLHGELSKLQKDACESSSSDTMFNLFTATVVVLVGRWFFA